MGCKFYYKICNPFLYYLFCDIVGLRNALLLLQFIIYLNHRWKYKLVHS